MNQMKETQNVVITKGHAVLEGGKYYRVSFISLPESSRPTEDLKACAFFVKNGQIFYVLKRPMPVDAEAEKILCEQALEDSLRVDTFNP